MKVHIGGFQGETKADRCAVWWDTVSHRVTLGGWKREDLFGHDFPSPEAAKVRLRGFVLPNGWKYNHCSKCNN